MALATDTVAPFKNPLSAKAYCHVPRINNQFINSRICDPQKILVSSERLELDRDLWWAVVGPAEAAQNSTESDDITHSLQIAQSNPNPPGPASGTGIYHHPDYTEPGVEIGIAVRRFSEDDSSSDVKTQCKTTFDNWGIGDKKCNNGVLIYLTTEDHHLYVCTGRGALNAPNYLSNGKLKRMINDVKPYLRQKEYFYALRSLLIKIRTTVWHENGPGIIDYNNANGSIDDDDDDGTITFQQFMFWFALVLLIILVIIGGSSNNSARERTQYNRAKDLIDRLHQQKERNLTAGRSAINDSCPICLEDFEDKQENSTKKVQPNPLKEPLLQSRNNNQQQEVDQVDQDSEEITLLHCGHRYHKDCLENWIRSRSSPSCPICRGPITQPSNAAGPITQSGPSAGNSSNLAGPITNPSNSAESDWYFLSSQDRIHREMRFRYDRVQYYYPDYVTNNMITRWSDNNFRGNPINDADFIAMSGGGSSSIGGGGGFGGGISGGGGGAGGSW